MRQNCWDRWARGEAASEPESGGLSPRNGIDGTFKLYPRRILPAAKEQQDLTWRSNDVDLGPPFVKPYRSPVWTICNYTNCAESTSLRNTVHGHHPPENAIDLWSRWPRAGSAGSANVLVMNPDLPKPYPGKSREPISKRGSLGQFLQERRIPARNFAVHQFCELTLRHGAEWAKSSDDDQTRHKCEEYRYAAALLGSNDMSGENLG